MTTAVIDPRDSSTAARRTPAIVLGLAGLAAVVFVGGFAIPYFLSSSYGPPEYAPRRVWLLLHIAGGMVALLTGPVQLWLGLADRGMAWHRRMGIAYVAAVTLGSVAGLYLAANTDFGWMFGTGLAALAIAWMVTTGMAFLAIKRGLYEQHKEWMVRSYVVTFAFVLFRLIFPALQAANIGTIGEQLAVAAWTSWSLPLVVTEMVIQGRKILAVKPV